MASTPKKSAAAAAAAAAVAESQVLEAPVIEAPVQEAPMIEAPHVEPMAAEATVDPAPAASNVEMTKLPTAALAEVTKMMEAPMAEVTKMMEAPMASLNETQDKVRTLIETGLTETRANYAKAKDAASEAASAMESTYSTVKTGVFEINVKALEALRTAAEANFDFLKSALAVKTPSEYLTLHGEFARKQIETLTAQTKAMSELAQKVATETVEPIKAQVAKTFKVAV